MAKKRGSSSSVSYSEAIHKLYYNKLISDDDFEILVDLLVDKSAIKEKLRTLNRLTEFNEYRPRRSSRKASKKAHNLRSSMFFSLGNN